MPPSRPDTTNRAADRAREGWIKPKHGRGMLRPFQPGNSGRPKNTSTRYSETLQLARAASPDAMRCLIERLHDPDGRIAVMAASLILERSWGRVVREMKPDEREQVSIDLSALSAVELKILADLAQSGRLRSVPSNESDDAAPTIEGKPE
jgi:hypothetical protein